MDAIKPKYYLDDTLFVSDKEIEVDDVLYSFRHDEYLYVGSDNEMYQENELSKFKLVKGEEQ